MSTPVPRPSSGEAVVPQSFAARFIGIFISPGETFGRIARKPDFLAPLITLVVLSVIVTEAMLAKIGTARLTRAAIEQSKRAATMSAEQRQQAVEQGARVGAVIAHIAGLVGTPLLLVIVAGIGLLIVNAIFGAQVDFRKAFSVASYAYLVTMPRTLMAIAMIFFGDPERFNPQNPTPTNPGFFLNPFETSGPLLAFVGSFDIFTLWLLVLLGIGFSEAAGRRVRAVSISLMFFGFWMVTVLARVGASMLG